MSTLNYSMVMSMNLRYRCMLRTRDNLITLNIHIVNSFDDIEYLNFDGVLCTTVNQTINDMLSDYDNIDELAFLEALSNYYFANNESFDNLKIKPNKLSIFNRIKQIAINYYCSD